MAVALVIIALLGWLAWSRYLNHKELMALQERGGNWQALVAAGERWRIRWGILTGIIVLLVGVALFAGCMLYMASAASSPGDARPFVAAEIVGAFIGVAGLAVLVAYIIWSRKQRTAEGGVNSESKE